MKYVNKHASMVVSILIDCILPCFATFTALNISKIAINGKKITIISNKEIEKIEESAESDIRTGAVIWLKKSANLVENMHKTYITKLKNESAKVTLELNVTQVLTLWYKLLIFEISPYK